MTADVPSSAPANKHSSGKRKPSYYSRKRGPKATPRSATVTAATNDKPINPSNSKQPEEEPTSAANSSPDATEKTPNTPTLEKEVAQTPMQALASQLAAARSGSKVLGLLERRKPQEGQMTELLNRLTSIKKMDVEVALDVWQWAGKRQYKREAAQYRALAIMLSAASRWKGVLTLTKDANGALSVPDQSLHLAAFTAHLQLAQPLQAWKGLQSMQVAQLTVPPTAYTDLMRLCMASGQHHLALSVWRALPAAASAADLLCAFDAAAATGDSHLAVSLFGRMLSLRLVLQPGQFAAALQACARVGEADAAVVFVNSMRIWGLEPSTLCYNHAIQAASVAGRWQMCEELFWRMHASGCQQNIYSMNILTAALSKAGEWEKALQIFHLANSLGLKHDQYSYNTAISACEKDGQWELAVQLMRQMRNAQLELTTITFNTAMSACVKGSQPQQALEIMRQMKREQVPVDRITVNVAAQACKNAGVWKMALHLLKVLHSHRWGEERATRFCIMSTLEAAQQWTSAFGVWRELQPLVTPDHRERFDQRGLALLMQLPSFDDNATCRWAIKHGNAKHEHELVLRAWKDLLWVVPTAPPQDLCALVLQSASEVAEAQVACAALQHLRHPTEEQVAMAVAACCKAGQRRQAIQLLEPQGGGVTAADLLLLLEGCAADGDWEQLLQLNSTFATILNTDSDAQRQQTSGTLVIAAFCQLGQWQAASQHICNRWGSGQKQQQQQRCVWQSGMQLLRQMQEAGLPQHPAVHTAVMRQCCAAGLWEKSLEVFRGLSDAAASSDAVCAMLEACRVGCQWMQALQVFDSHKNTSPRPSTGVYCGLLGALAEGEQWAVVLEKWEEMGKLSVPKDSTVYNLMMEHAPSDALAMQLLQAAVKAAVYDPPLLNCDGATTMLRLDGLSAGAARVAVVWWLREMQMYRLQLDNAIILCTAAAHEDVLPSVQEVLQELNTPTFASSEQGLQCALEDLRGWRTRSADIHRLLQRDAQVEEEAEQVQQEGWITTGQSLPQEGWIAAGQYNDNNWIEPTPEETVQDTHSGGSGQHMPQEKQQQEEQQEQEESLSEEEAEEHVDLSWQHMDSTDYSYSYTYEYDMPRPTESWGAFDNSIAAC